MLRLIGLLEFFLALGAIGAIGLALSTQFGKPQRYLRALAALGAFPAVVWLTSFARQIVFETRTDGAISSQVDSCTTALMPILVVVMSFVLVVLAEVYAVLGVLQNARHPPERLTILTFVSRNEC